MKEKKFTFGKVITAIVLIFFVVVMNYGLYLTTCPEINETLIITIIGAIGTVTATTLVFYYRKSQSENLLKINSSMYKEMTDNRFEYNKRMLELRRDMGVDQSVIDEIEMDSDADEYMDMTKERAITDMDTFVNDAHTMIERQDL